MYMTIKKKHNQLICKKARNRVNNRQEWDMDVLRMYGGNKICTPRRELKK